MTSSKLKIIVILGIWGLILFVGVGISVLLQEPQQLGRRLSQEVADQLGVSCIVREAHLDFWPSPGLRATEVLVRTPQGHTLAMEACTINIQWLPLLKGKIVPGNIELLHPLLLAEQDTRLDQQANATPPVTPVFAKPVAETAAMSAAMPSTPSGAASSSFTSTSPATISQSSISQAPHDWRNVLEAIKGMNLSVQNGGARLTRTNLDGTQNTLFLSGLTGFLDVPGLLSSDADLTFETLEMRDAQNEFPLVLKNTTLKARLSLEGSNEAPSLNGSVQMNGSLMVQQRATPVKLVLPMKLHYSPDKGFEAQITEGRVQLDADSAVLNGQAVMAPAPAWQGTVNVQHFSLPRWFGFARNFPEGLQWALDDLSGVLETRLNLNGLEVPKAHISLMGITFEGTGGVERFDTPVIRLDMRAKDVDINTIFPEVLNKEVVAPLYAAPPAVPASPDEITVGFDIRLGADMARVWKVNGKNLHLQITQLPQGAHLVASLNDVHGGTVQATADIEDFMIVNGQVTNVNSEPLLAQFMDKGALGGKLSGKIDFKSSTDSMSRFVAGITGSLQATLVDGFFMQTPAEASKKPFTKLTLNVNRATKDLAVSAAPVPSKLVPFNAVWKAAVKMPFQGKELSAELSLNGPVFFSTANGLPVAGEGLPVRLSARLAGSEALVEGLTSFDRLRGNVDVRSFKAALDNGTAAGSVSVRDFGGSAAWKGQLNLNTPNLRHSLELLGFPLENLLMKNLPENAFRRVQAEGSFTHSPEAWQLSNLKGKVDDTTFSGDMGYRNGTIPQWKGDVRLGRLNVQNYIPQSTDTKGKKNATPWPVEILRTFGLNLRLQIESLVVAHFEHQNLILPVQVTGGVLSATPISATVYNGTMNGNVRSEVTPQGLLTKIHYEVKDLNLLTLSQKRKQKTTISGLGGLALDVNGLVLSAADIPAAFNGQWGIHLRNGAVSSKGNKSKTRFSVFQASGAMTRGVLTSNNIYADGPGLKLRGKSDIDLVTWTMYANLVASIPGVPEIPITVQGSLDNPQMDVNTLRAIGGTLGNIGSGVFNLLGDVISAPFKLLK